MSTQAYTGPLSGVNPPNMPTMEQTIALYHRLASDNAKAIDHAKGVEYGKAVDKAASLYGPGFKTTMRVKSDGPITTRLWEKGMYLHPRTVTQGPAPLMRAVEVKGETVLVASQRDKLGVLKAKQGLKECGHPDRAAEYKRRQRWYQLVKLIYKVHGKNAPAIVEGILAKSKPVEEPAVGVQPVTGRGTVAVRPTEPVVAVAPSVPMPRFCLWPSRTPVY